MVASAAQARHAAGTAGAFSLGDADVRGEPFRHSLPMTLAFAATASRPTAVLTGP